MRHRPSVMGLMRRKAAASVAVKNTGGLRSSSDGGAGSGLVRSKRRNGIYSYTRRTFRDRTFQPVFWPSSGLTTWNNSGKKIFGSLHFAPLLEVRGAASAKRGARSWSGLNIVTRSR